MIGISSSESRLRKYLVAFAVPLALVGALPADEISLTGNAKLSGTVREILEDGSVFLDSEVSPEPLKLKADAIKRIGFSDQAVPDFSPSARVELANGDRFAADIEALEGGQFAVHSPLMGRVMVDRSVLEAVHLGVARELPVYIGPDNVEQWESQNNGDGDWRFEDGNFVVEGNGKIAREFEIPDSFILKFTLAWQESAPAFQIFFCDPQVALGTRSDRYIFQIGNSGMEIKREAENGRQHTSVASIIRPSDQLRNKAVTIEMRVDRPGATIQLYVDGKFEGRYGDPVSNVPSAGGVVLSSTGGSNNRQVLSDISIMKWDVAADRQRVEERGDVNIDAVISRNADRYPGELLNLTNQDGQMIYSFKSEFREGALELPEEEISSIYFARKTRPEVVKDVQFVLRLRDGGAMSVLSCEFKADKVGVVHPLLGPLSLNRNGVLAIERKSPPKTASKD